MTALAATVGLALATLASANSRAPAAAAIGGPCAKQTASQLEIDDVAGVLCGSFVGPGSTAMAVMITNGTCLPFLGWNLYVLEGGSWEPVRLPAHGGFTGVPLKKVGTAIVETLPIPDPGKPICLADRGTKTRTWEWNGSAFSPGAWKFTYTKPKAPKPNGAGETYVASPSGNLQCVMRARNVYCQSFVRDHSVTLFSDGRLTTCRADPPRKGCAGNAGEDVRFRSLAYGQSVTVPPFRCASASVGITCTVIRTGKGFLIDKGGIKKVG